MLFGIGFYALSGAPQSALFRRRFFEYVSSWGRLLEEGLGEALRRSPISLRFRPQFANMLVPFALGSAHGLPHQDSGTAAGAGRPLPADW